MATAAPATAAPKAAAPEEGLASRAFGLARAAAARAAPHAPLTARGAGTRGPLALTSTATVSTEAATEGPEGSAGALAEDGCTGFRLAQRLWDQRLQAAARTHASAAVEQWDLLVENGNAHANAIMELMKDVSSLKSELSRQRGELKGCVSSLMMLDKRSAEQTERLIKEHHDKMAEGLDGADKKHRAELECLEAHLVGLLSAATRREQDARAAHVQESVARCEQELRSDFHGERDRHASHLEELRVELRGKHDQHAAHLEELRAELCGEHDRHVARVEDQLCRHDEAHKKHQEAHAAHGRQLEDAHQRSRALEVAVQEHAGWVDRARQQADRCLAELEELRTKLVAQDGQLERTSRDLLSEVKQDHDRRVLQIKDELLQLDTAIRRSQEAHAADVEELKLQIVRERADFAADLQSETGKQLRELQQQLRRVDEDLRSHWHNLSLSERLCCGAPELAAGRAEMAAKGLPQEALISTSARYEQVEASPRSSEHDQAPRRCSRRAPFELGPVRFG